MKKYLLSRKVYRLQAFPDINVRVLRILVHDSAKVMYVYEDLFDERNPEFETLKKNGAKISKVKIEGNRLRLDDTKTVEFEWED